MKNTKRAKEEPYRTEDKEAIARLYLASVGFEVAEGVSIETSRNPRAQVAWKFAEGVIELLDK